VRYDEESIKAKRSSTYFSIDNIDEALQKNGEIRCPMKLALGLVFHSKLIHKSGVNQSTKTRFALQSRWFNGLSSDSVRGKFRGGLDEGVHPKEYL
jgi:ectoine hydroxylase-related dioxygenase (phytanoyl-CoA dioxygenase family)